jgi:hypothetical protein
MDKMRKEIESIENLESSASILAENSTNTRSETLNSSVNKAKSIVNRSMPI